MARKVIDRLIFFLFLLVTPLQGADKLDPFFAEFAIITDNSSLWTDISVSLDICIHKTGLGRLPGSKFVCRENIDTVKVTDGEGRNLPFIVKKYPRKKIIWEYASSKDGTRRAKIEFIMRNGLKQEKDTYIMTIDWIGGWRREIQNATYRIVLPKEITENDIISVFPTNFQFSQTNEASMIVHTFPVLKEKALKLVIKHPKTARLKAPDIKDAQVKKETANTQNAMRKSQKIKDLSSKPVLEDIRYGLPNDSTERVVFDLNRNTPYKVTYDPQKRLLEVIWKVPIEIARKVIEKGSINGEFIRGLQWKKARNQEMSCIINLKRKDLNVDYGDLDNPFRVYVDVFLDLKNGFSPEKKEPSVISKKKGESDKTQSMNLKKPELKEKALQPIETTSLTTTTTVPVKKEAPIEEKIEYRKAQRLLKLGNYLNAIETYEKFLNRYPNTILKEKVIFEIADSYYKLADEKEQKYYDHAVRAYKKAIANFPQSNRHPQAAYRIAESHRKRKFFIEAKSQYQLVVKEFPDSPLATDSRYWIAECLYQMQQFKEALREFERFLDDFPTSPHQREATFRIADCYVQTKDFDKAEFYYEKAMKRWPDLIRIPVDSLNNMAMTDYFMGKFEKCREIFFLSFNLYPSQQNRARLLRFIGDSYQWEGEMQNALNIYGHLVTLFKDYEESLIGIMRMADLGVNVEGLQSGKFSFEDYDPYRNPEEAYRWIIKSNPTDDLLTEAFYKLGFTLAKKGNYVDAIGYFKRSMYQKEKGEYYKKSFENIQKILIKMIQIATDKKDYFAVIELYKKNEKVFLSPIEDCRLLYNVGFGYLELGFHDIAEELFYRIVNKTVDEGCKHRSYICLSQIDVQKGKLQQAEENLNLLLYGSKVAPVVAKEAYHILGDAYFLHKKYKEAVDAYSVPLKEQGVSFRDAKSLFRMGESFGRLEYYYNAIRALKKLLSIANQIEPQNSELGIFIDEAQLLIGDYLNQAENYKAAIIAYRKLADSTSNKEKKGWALLKWGDALMKTGDHENAGKVFTDLSEEMPYTFLGRFALARMNDLEWKKSLQSDLEHFL